MRRVLVCAAMLLFGTIAWAQESVVGELEPYVNVEELLPADVEVQGATQGFAVYGRYGFSMHDKGQCVVIDLRRREFVATYVMTFLFYNYMRIKV